MSATAGLLQQLQVIEGASEEEREAQYDVLASMLASAQAGALSSASAPLAAAQQSPGSSTWGPMAAEPSPLKGRLVLEGSCSKCLTHSLDPLVAALRSKHRTPIYCGDWELRVLAVPREEQSFSAFVAENPGEEDKDEELSATYAAGNMCPADALWELTNFGTLFWEGPENWVLPPGEQWYSKRIWVELDPHGDHAGVVKSREEALQSLDEVPGGELPANAAAKATHTARIKADLDLLEELVARRGSIGATVLPDALQPIIECHAVHQDGNYRSATFATADYCFYICMSTS